MVRALSTKLALIALPPSCVLLDTGLAGLRGWRSASRLDAGFVLLCAIPLLVLLGAVATRRGRRWLDKQGGKLCLVVYSLLFGWALGEIAVGFAAKAVPTVPFHLHHPNLQRRFRPSPGVMPGIRGESTFTTNSLGVRGPEREAGSINILCVGGSTTICTYLDDTETWPHHLLHELRQRCPARPS